MRAAGVAPPNNAEIAAVLPVGAVVSIRSPEEAGNPALATSAAKGTVAANSRKPPPPVTTADEIKIALMAASSREHVPLVPLSRAQPQVRQVGQLRWRNRLNSGRDADTPIDHRESK